MKATDFITGGFAMLKQYSKTAWMIIIPMALLSFGINMLMANAQAENMRAMLANPLNYNPFAGMGTIFPILIVSMILGAVIAVGWHRRGLLDEAFTWSPAQIFRAPVLNYVGNILLIALIFIGIGFVVGVAMAIVGTILVLISPTLALIILIPAYFVFLGIILIFLQRLSLKLPASAIEKPITIKQALAETKGHHWFFLRLVLMIVLIAIVVMLPILIPSFSNQIAMQKMLLTGAGDVDAIIDALRPSLFVQIYTAFIGAAIGLYQVGILTLLYAHFIGDDEAAA